jgi:hypothetical protein
LTPVETEWQGAKLRHYEITGFSNGGKVTVRGADVSVLISERFPSIELKVRPVRKANS